MNTSYQNTYDNYSAAQAPAVERASFIRKTYLHLAGAILAFAALEFLLIASGVGAAIAQTMMGVSWLFVIAAFMGVSFLANWWANSSASKPMQYLGLGLFVAAESVIFLPMLYIANYSAGGGVIVEAGIYTLALFGALTTIVFITRQDFSFLRPILMIGGFLALGFVVVSLLFGFSIGSLFSLIMVAFAAAAILYDTSNVLHHYRTDQHVAASLSLFASVALLFWYILRIFSSRD
jgi:FtsH-binding integral membrane protein